MKIKKLKLFAKRPSELDIAERIRRLYYVPTTRVTIDGVGDSSVVGRQVVIEVDEYGDMKCHCGCHHGSELVLLRKIRKNYGRYSPYYALVSAGINEAYRRYQVKRAKAIKALKDGRA